jgi:hypothetical protein
MALRWGKLACNEIDERIGSSALLAALSAERLGKWG